MEAGLVTEPEKAMDSVKIIRREARRMTRIIDDLLFISKLENDGDQAPVTQVNIRDLLEEIKEALMPSMMEKNITLEISGGEFSVPAGLRPYAQSVWQPDSKRRQIQCGKRFGFRAGGTG